jgi:hypothetical protein
MENNFFVVFLHRKQNRKNMTKKEVNRYAELGNTEISLDGILTILSDLKTTALSLYNEIKILNNTIKVL